MDSRQPHAVCCGTCARTCVAEDTVLAELGQALDGVCVPLNFKQKVLQALLAVRFGNKDQLVDY
jgi:hypothetical protein